MSAQNPRLNRRMTLACAAAPLVGTLPASAGELRVRTPPVALSIVDRDSGQVLDPGRSYDIAGWRKSDTRIAALEFAALDNFLVAAGVIPGPSTRALAFPGGDGRGYVPDPPGR